MDSFFLFSNYVQFSLFRTLIEEKSQLSVTPSTCTGSSTQSTKRDLSNNNENDNSCPKRYHYYRLNHLTFQIIFSHRYAAALK